ncbi:MAG: flavin reductase family protein [Defluviicoccus sp.]|nr:flavin reductase family protein [Defluviicoccus sp.]MDE0276013.1 flavin reductase family protein [Defluviicoccus sp.]
MFYEPRNNDYGLPFNPLKACVVPRPIGWISTVDAEGAVNLAPFSFFNMLSYNPPYVLFSSGMHSDSAHKDTVLNIEQTGEFVYNMATWDQREAMNLSALIVERSVDELAAAGLEPLPSSLVKPPRVKGAPVHFECRHYRTLDLPGRTPRAAHKVVIGEVVGVHIDDGALTADGLLDVARIRPIGRLGYMDYVSVEKLFSMKKETPEEQIGQAAE